ncbi:MAG: hypothetical protein HQK60_06715 [Deltaproteobacteria bacterium]|nr:hypothetical protein [Deltaproteobacteria bacterium]
MLAKSNQKAGTYLVLAKLILIVACGGILLSGGCGKDEKEKKQISIESMPLIAIQGGLGGEPLSPQFKDQFEVIVRSRAECYNNALANYPQLEKCRELYLAKTKSKLQSGKTPSGITREVLSCIVASHEGSDNTLQPAIQCRKCKEDYIMKIMETPSVNEAMLNVTGGFISCVRQCPAVYGLCHLGNRDKQFDPHEIDLCVMDEILCIEHCLSTYSRGRILPTDD